MTNEQTFKKAIEKAVKNGYVHSAFSRWTNKTNAKELTLMVLELNPYTFNVNDIIFSHDFAKAFWGKRRLYKDEPEIGHICSKIKIWQSHLQQMVLEKEPLKYLKKFIDL